MNEPKTVTEANAAIHSHLTEGFRGLIDQVHGQRLPSALYHAASGLGNSFKLACEAVERHEAPRQVLSNQLSDFMVRLAGGCDGRFTRTENWLESVGLSVKALGDAFKRSHGIIPPELPRRLREAAKTLPMVGDEVYYEQRLSTIAVIFKTADRLEKAVSKAANSDSSKRGFWQMILK